MSYSVIFVTTKNIDEAEVIAREILKNRLAACINIVPQIKSLYWDKEKIEESKEAFMLIKTKAELVKKLIDSIRELHSYSIPEILSLQIKDGNKDYFKWIDQNVVQS